MKFIGRHVRLSSLKDEIKYYGVNAAQVFTKAPQQWYGNQIYEHQRIKYNPNNYYICAHAGYLINMANVHSQSRNALLLEARRCSVLGIPDLVVHPGSGSAQAVVDLLSSYGDEWPHNVRLLLENTAGQGKYLGGLLEELQYIIDHVSNPLPLGICYDTAHAWGHGNSIVSEILHPMIKLIHLNDSAVQFGSRKDRHANMNKGFIPAEIFHDIAQRVTVPCIMETPEDYATQDLEFFKNLLN
jgi:deoxyribonuclease-4